jgi:hypothetical protein
MQAGRMENVPKCARNGRKMLNEIAGVTGQAVPFDRSPIRCSVRAVRPSNAVVNLTGFGPRANPAGGFTSVRKLK